MKLSETQLRHSNVKFHGIVPGRQGRSLGNISSEVTFGKPDNHRSKMISFKVLPFKSAYHAIFGCPTFAKFMAWPCYIYNKLKMLGPKGTITVYGDFRKSRDCGKGNAAFAEAVLNAEELEQLKKELNTEKKPSSPKYKILKSSEQTKKIKLTDEDPSKTAIIGSGLGVK